eukprot:TRINITY_DN40707_c0_g1_i3.p2 TRINITY_DN40707_c0_g1~~TRINITY_DN40707_c0_g1_i3.p2  ORF type:complete len:138 (+),score=40.50 TRINITY_DN40707_c0_g1_i3:89-502(+)
MMKLIVALNLGFCCAIALATPVPPEETAEVEDTYIPREMLDYLVDVRVQQELERILGDQGMKTKRAWRNRWGNKYADNKSYGFWITALNKAGNYKRGKREAPFVPAMSAPQPPFTIFKDDESNLKELIPDHDYSHEQ